MKANGHRWRPGKERERICGGCRKPMFLSVEGYRCLRCPDVWCQRCAVLHFAEMKEMVTAALVQRELQGVPSFSITLKEKDYKVLDLPAILKKHQRRKR